MEPQKEAAYKTVEFVTRRHFLKNCVTGLGGVALAGLMGGCNRTGSTAGNPKQAAGPFVPRAPHFFPKAKSVIFLHMAGAPSQLELFDYKPELHKLDGQYCPPSLLEGKRFAFIQGVPKMLGPQATFRRHGESGTMVSNLLPHFSQIVDDVTVLKAMQTNEFNHAPGQLLMQTGHARPGFPSLGSWITYGLGSENQNLPGFLVLLSGASQPDAGRSVFGSGFLPSVYQGVQCRSEGDPVLYLNSPDGVSRNLRRESIDAINRINERQYAEIGDPEIMSRISQYEMAFRMQISAPDIMDISKEPESIQAMYGARPGEASFANNCLLARRLVERGVRFVQLFHWGWDAHGVGKSEALNYGFLDRCKEVDRPMTALVQDLKQRGLLDETIVVWGGEFGRTPMLENRGGTDNPFVGRDHHSEAFTMWAAGGGFKPGFTYGETDEIGFYGVDGQMHVHDLQATILNQLGMDHTRLTYHFQGRDFRLTDVHGNVINDILA